MKTLKVLSTIFVCIIATTSLQAQTVVKSNKNKKVIVKKNNNKKVVVKGNKHNTHATHHGGHHPHHHGNNKVIIKNNRKNVIVKKPVIRHGQSHKYKSGCLLASPFGAMYGYYRMINLSNTKKFNVIIPSFKLSAPFAIN